MAVFLLACSIILIICIASSKFTNKFGVPTLLLFIVLGMLAGSDGILGISFDDYGLTEQICSAALIFIMFYGGFGTNWKAARPVAVKSILLSSLGVILTAFITGLFCHFVLKMSILEGLLVGSVIGSTDAASVFSILRSKNLNLKHGLASMLEIESGSNDPFSYMLTMIVLALMSADKSISIPYMIFAQIFFGVFFGFAIAFISVYILKRISFEINGLHTIFVVAIALLAYSVPASIGGNGYLSVYIAGIVLGNSKILHKVELVHFFDGVTWLMQILIFFSLGLLSFPSQMPGILLSALAIAFCLTFISRPLAVFCILSPFKVPFRQQLLVAWSGLRGAASIVFAIYCMTSGTNLSKDIFHIVFCVSLLSVTFQGTLLPVFARKLALVDDSDTVLKTFTDYQDSSDIKLVEIQISENHSWTGKELSEIILPPDSLVVMIKRGTETIIPKGDTVISCGDVLVLSCTEYRDDSEIRLQEIQVCENHEWINAPIKDLGIPEGSLVVMIKRENENIIPNGDTVVKENDVIVMSINHPDGIRT